MHEAIEFNANANQYNGEWGEAQKPLLTICRKLVCCAWKDLFTKFIGNQTPLNPVPNIMHVHWSNEKYFCDLSTAS